MIEKFDAWHKTKAGLLVFAVLELLLAYLFISLAIDRGSLIYYILALVMLFGFLQNTVKFVGKFLNGKK